MSSSFPKQYEKSEQRTLYLVAHKLYKTMTALCEHFGCVRQFGNYLMRQEVPIKYAGYLGRKYGFHPALLNYEDYVVVGGEQEYKDLFSGKFFSKEEMEYILDGKVPDGKKIVTKSDKGMGK